MHHITFLFFANNTHFTLTYRFKVWSDLKILCETLDVFYTDIQLKDIISASENVMRVTYDNVDDFKILFVDNDGEFNIDVSRCNYFKCKAFEVYVCFPFVFFKTKNDVWVIKW